MSSGDSDGNNDSVKKKKGIIKELSSSITELHVQKLRNICRLCGKTIGDGDRYDKYKLKEELKYAYGIHVESDVKEVHPPSICRYDGRYLYKVKTAFQTNQPIKAIKTVTVAPTFVLHGEDCNICSNKNIRTNAPARGRPKKKKYPFDPESEITEEIPEEMKESKSGTFKAEQSSDVLLLQIRKLISVMDSDEVETFFMKILSSLHASEISIFSYCLGKVLSSQINEDANSFFSLYKNVQKMADFDTFQWLQNRNQTLVAFLMGIGNMKNTVASLENLENRLLAISRGVEQVYMICYPTLISPISFLLNVCMYSLTGSKNITDMLGNSSPAGHYKTVTQWLRDQGSSEPVIPGGDLINVFDNEQVIGRKHTIKPNNRANLSIITNKGYVQLTSNSIQGEILLKPLAINIIQDHHKETFTKLNEVIKEVMEQSSKRFLDFEKTHYEQLFCFISKAIEVVTAEQSKEENNITDNIDESVRQSTFDETMIKCASCGTVNRKRKIVCDGCKQKEGLKMAKELKKTVDTSTTSSDDPKSESFLRFSFEKGEDENMTVIQPVGQYEQVQTNHKGSHQIVLTDPVFCNPNSFETIARVLRKIGIENKIYRYGGSKRHWTFICCDGLPYLICKKLKEEAVVCTVPECGKSFYKKASLLLHAKEVHPERKDCPFIYEFDWFYLRIGAGHYEMNLLKSFFELNWIPYLEILCERMGFVSEQAKQYAKACKDTHKSWNLLLIFHLSCLRELVLPYVRHCLKEQITPEAKGFLKYSNNTYQSGDLPNFQYLMDQVCRFSQGIINFRMAVRRNNSSLLESAKFMTKELFHGRQHPKYQIIKLYDVIQNILMPEEVKIVNDSFASITTSDNYSTGEDFDFILEEKNRQLKSWIPKGLPTDSIWQTVCRNNIVLERVKMNSMALFGIKTEKGKPRKLDMEASIAAFRCILRKTDYLNKKRDHTSLTGFALDEELVSFIEKATQKRKLLLKSEFLKEDVDFVQMSRQPLPITPEEREKLQKIEKMTLSEIKKEIEQVIAIIQDPIQYDYHLQLYKNDLKGKKRNTILISCNN